MIFLTCWQDHTGDLLFSLSYQSHSNRITVVVLKARNLKAVNRIGACGTGTHVLQMIDQ